MRLSFGPNKENDMSSCGVALIREQGVEFAVVCVNDALIENQMERDEAIAAWSRDLGRPSVLMGSYKHRVYGRTDLVNFLSHVHPARLPWRRMTI